MAKLLVDGHEYEFVGPDDFTIGEARVLFRYSKVPLDALQDSDESPFSNPNVMAAIVHIHVAREHPDWSFERIEREVDRVKMVTLDVKEDEEEKQSDPPPPAPPSESEPSDRSSDGSGANGDGLPREPVTLEATGVPV